LLTLYFTCLSLYGLNHWTCRVCRD